MSTTRSNCRTGSRRWSARQREVRGGTSGDDAFDANTFRILPLSPRAALCIGRPSEDLSIDGMAFNAAAVKGGNIAVARRADRYLMASSEEELRRAVGELKRSRSPVLRREMSGHETDRVVHLTLRVCRSHPIFPMRSAHGDVPNSRPYPAKIATPRKSEQDGPLQFRDLAGGW